VASDGKVGPQTIGASNADKAPVATIQKACAIRMGFLRGLGTWSKFGRGWSRRVASVEAVAVRMSLEASGVKSRDALMQEKDFATHKAQRHQVGAGSSVGAGGASTLADIPTWGLIAVGVAVVIAVVVILGNRRHEIDRADAYQKAAEGAKA